MHSHHGKKAHLKKKKSYKKKQANNDEAVKADPLVSLGFGVCAYRDILWSFLWTFCLFSFLLYPQMQIFNAGTAYANLASSLSYKEHGMLVNMGYSTVNCASMPIEVG